MAVALGLSGVAEAQDQAAAPATAVSPVATPFVGEYPVWCTSGNPAPNNLCGSHHRTPAIDIGMDIGTEIRATGDGLVVDVESGCGTAWCRGGAGNFVAVEHADGNLSRYLHLSATSVEEGELVTTGQLVGLSGDTGQSTTPHLHYDEQFPIGTRVPFGPWLACVDGELVQYPDSVGYASWLDVPFGTMLRNDGYDCLVDVRLVPDPPALLSGPGVVAVGVVPGKFGSEFELETIKFSGDTATTTVTSLEPGRRRALAVADGDTYTFRVRTRIGGAWSDWSDSVDFVLEAVEAGPTCRGFYRSTVEGTAGPDVLIGTAGDDVIDAGGGDDIVCGAGGSDVILGGEGDDIIEAGAGHDVIDAGAGRDRVVGGLGHDVIDGGIGRDRIASGAGADEVVGGTGSDVLIGGVGADEIRAGGGNDRVKGGGGDDQILGGGGNDRLFGNSGTDSLDGGAGTDSCEAEESDTAERCER